MRDWKHMDYYVSKLYGDIYPQPETDGHTTLAEKVIRHWASRMTTCKTVLDVGCGDGFCQPMFEEWGMSYTGIALGEDVIEAGKMGRNVSRMDFNFLEFDDGSFDLIFARHSLEHSPMPLLTLMEWYRVAKHWLGIVVPAPEWYGYGGRNHYSVMNIPQIKFLIEVSGWKVLWEKVDELVFDQKKPTELRPHEYWFMLEKRR